MDGPHYGGKPVHFPFLEGQFSSHRCHACGGRCCEGTRGLTLAASQIDLIDSLGGPSAILARDASALYLDTSEGCPALRPDGLCALHAQHGLRGKPALCALFPYVALSDHGPFYSLAPNLAYACPLSADFDADEPVARFADVLADLEHFFPAGSAPATMAPLHPAQPVDRAEERAIIHAAERVRGHGDFADVLCEVRGAGARRALEEDRRRLRTLGAAAPMNVSDTDFFQRALPLVGILRSWLFGEPRRVVDAATDLALRTLRVRMRRAVSDRGATDVQRMARALQRDLTHVRALARGLASGTTGA